MEKTTEIKELKISLISLKVVISVILYVAVLALLLRLISISDNSESRNIQENAKITEKMKLDEEKLPPKKHHYKLSNLPYTST